MKISVARALEISPQSVTLMLERSDDLPNVIQLINGKGNKRINAHMLSFMFYISFKILRSKQGSLNT